ncbi:MAG: Flp pilus assembly complex ATPase component TadA [Leptotrichiaceae bacterium]|nr:Flp pilus assembly complex ATPase component TadA [Leptotrichiaceae bacterium]
MELNKTNEKTEKELQIAKYKKNLAIQQFGEEIWEYLFSDDYIEIMLNPDQHIWVENYEKKWKTDIFIDEKQASRIITAVASENGKELGKTKNSIISGTLITGDRFEGISGEESKNKTIFCIRKKAKKIFTLDEYESSEVITSEQKEYIKQMIFERKNILIVGGTGSGKTTFINACLNELKDTDFRVITIEDTDELQCSAEDTIKLYSTPLTSSKIILESIMRMRPDIVIVGELRRGEEVQALLKAWNSGHDGGLSTTHANSCVGGILKLQQLLTDVKDINTDSLALMIMNSVDIIVTIKKIGRKRKITEIAELKEYDHDRKKFILDYVCEVK